jgi:soluble lytic murein transglycosylase-like protein
MKSIIAALALALLPGLAAAKKAPAKAAAAKPVEGQAKLLADIEAWRSLHLPKLTPPSPLTLRYEPRLDDIKNRAQAAKTAKALLAPVKDFTDWKQAVLRDEFVTAQSRGTTKADFAQFSADQAQAAAFSADLRAQIAQRALEGSIVAEQRKSLLAAASNSAGAFDGSRALGMAGDAVVTAPPPLDPKDPARYDKVRQLLISQGARPAIVDTAIQEAIRQNADPLLVLAVIKQESQFNPHAHSGVGARGLMQIMPDTGRGLGVRDSGALYDVRTNIRAGIKYLKQLWDRFTDISMTSLDEINPFADHDVKAAVAAYNAGPGAVHKYDGVPPYRETQGYVQKVLGYYSQMRQYLGW